MHESDVIALVLAAGRGRRFGQDKRCVVLDDGKTLLRATLDTLKPHFAQVRVVVRPEDSSDALQIDQEHLIRSLNADRGMGFSIADGFSALPESQAKAAAVLLADMPCIEPETFQLLIEHAGADRIVRPEFHGRGGHPVLFGRDFWGNLSHLQGEEGARSVIHAHQDACIFIEVDDPGVLMDADRPDELEALQARYRILRQLE